MSKSKGFTLIELMIVVAIIGILAAIFVGEGAEMSVTITSEGISTTTTQVTPQASKPALLSEGTAWQ